jgi:hypothetical protein
MNEVPRVLDGGWKLASRHEEHGEDGHGVAIYVKVPRDTVPADNNVLRKAADEILSALHVETLRLNPEACAEAAKEKAAILDCFRDRNYVEPIPNGYCNQWCCHFKPWYIVTTRLGRIKIGWRKSVLHLEWTDSVIGKTADRLFPNEEVYPGCAVTKYDKVIHCHGYEKAKQYIDVLMQQEPAGQ